MNHPGRDAQKVSENRSARAWGKKAGAEPSSQSAPDENPAGLIGWDENRTAVCPCLGLAAHRPPPTAHFEASALCTRPLVEKRQGSLLCNSHLPHQRSCTVPQPRNEDCSATSAPIKPTQIRSSALPGQDGGAHAGTIP